MLDSCREAQTQPKLRLLLIRVDSYFAGLAPGGSETQEPLVPLGM